MKAARILMLAMILSLVASSVAVSQVASSGEGWRKDHTPRKALIRATLLPGWGQLYNHQYGKVPVVYLVLGGLTVNTIRLNNKYLLYRHAFQFKAFDEITEEGEDNPRASFEADYERLFEQIRRTTGGRHFFNPVAAALA